MSSAASDQRVCTAEDGREVTGADVIAYVDRLVENSVMVCGGSQLRGLVVAAAFAEEERLRADSRLRVEGGLGFVDAVVILLRHRLSRVACEPSNLAGVARVLAGS